MSKNLKDKRIAILATEGFEYVELTEPKKALEAAARRLRSFRRRTARSKAGITPIGATQ